MQEKQKLRFAYIEMGMGWTEVVRFLILANVTIFAVQELAGQQWFLSHTFGLVPRDFFAGKIWQIITYMFLHGGLGHIFFNMLALWMFGSILERQWGSRRFLFYYLLTGLGGGLSYALFNMGSGVPTVGASGAIYGLLTAYAVLFPENIIYVWFIIPLKAKWFALIFGAIEFMMSFSAGSGVAHLAHLGGMVVGYVYLKRDQFLRRKRMRGFEDWRESRAEAARQREEEDLDKVRREVDELLDKINRVGFDGLTKAEQKRLEKASKILRERERQL